MAEKFHSTLRFHLVPSTIKDVRFLPFSRILFEYNPFPFNIPEKGVRTIWSGSDCAGLWSAPPPRHYPHGTPSTCKNGKLRYFYAQSHFATRLWTSGRRCRAGSRGGVPIVRRRHTGRRLLSLPQWLSLGNGHCLVPDRRRGGGGWTQAFRLGHLLAYSRQGRRRGHGRCRRRRLSPLQGRHRPSQKAGCEVVPALGGVAACFPGRLGRCQRKGYRVLRASG